MTEPEWTEAEDCGCKRATPREGVQYMSLCRFHWNVSNIKHELDEAMRWKAGRRLDPEEWSDRRVLNFFDQLCYWAAKGIGDAGSVGSIYSAAAERRRT